MEGGQPSQISRRDIDALSKAKRIYVATVRKDGNQSRSVPVWFTLTPDNSVLIETGPTTWIAKRVRRGSPVIVWIGRRHGPALIGDAQITGDRELTKRIIDHYPRKYLLARLGFLRPRQAGFDAGKILAIKITPIRDLPDGFVSRAGIPAPRINPDVPCSSATEA